MNTRSFFSIMALTMLMGLLVLPAHAQNQRPDRRATPDQRIERLDARLNLSDDQEARLKTLWTEHREAAQAWHEANPDATREARQAFAASHREAMHAAMENILTPEQAEQFAALKETARNRAPMRGQGRRGGQGDGRFEPGRHRGGFGMGLNLTEDQRTQLQAFHTAHREAAQAWHEANPDATREARQAFAASHREAMHAAMENILTPEQEEQMEAMKAKRQHRAGKHRSRRR